MLTCKDHVYIQCAHMQFMHLTASYRRWFSTLFYSDYQSCWLYLLPLFGRTALSVQTQCQSSLNRAPVVRHMCTMGQREVSCGCVYLSPHDYYLGVTCVTHDEVYILNATSTVHMTDIHLLCMLEIVFCN